MKFEDLRIGMFEEVGKTITEADVVNYAGLSLDINPIHLNNEYAKNSIFKERIVHGMLTSGLISAVLGTKLPGEGSIYLSQTLKFISPVKIGDTITAKAEIIDINPEKKIITIKTTCINQNKSIVIDGEAKVLKK
ncbi:MaoC family dehydratase [Fusobacterium nucleatum]|uniref:Dehydrogenase n=2 Tax=Fusobacterium nucleatum subsp. nucleatum TaxID=76856 RepID=Q8RFA0_FUSNN|nr:MaoC family dehydratase [Fusobacterium nucleatum]AAL95012.1 dehydrogenase with MaoC-like domain [Fusobacterium nucleatum subsp. nucleatum ATCC 25586]ALF24236.1 enoyl-CoA hydratase [Fusobacterium nucleatum subsp. nucleatum ChDC F316]ALF25277.1 enoyl-CoA hydratase [Fusobacterium nucleatum subsp. nucleatum]ASG26478.1 dehydrogenase [Fusobacterium nucleatum subsp. nucleatum]AVQ15198.1 dehydrogenase [Fusobacterium nucleatum subsp. nucleatum ATCC 25586]